MRYAAHPSTHLRANRPPPFRDETVPGQPAPARKGEIRSADVATLTSPDLVGLKGMINEAARQRAELAPDRAAALASRARAWRTLRRCEQLPLRLILRGRIPAARAAFEAAEDEALNVVVALAQSEVRIDFQLGPDAIAAFAALASAHAALARCAGIWDVTTSVGIDRIRARSVASSAITRVRVTLGQVDDSIVGSAQAGMRFGNANGGDLDLFPALLLMRTRGGGDYALIDLRQVCLDVQPRSFVEDEAVPPDASVIDHAWARANRDGSPDRRFRDNRQIPIVRYGELQFSTPEGMAEAYHFSNYDAALSFGQAFHSLQAALVRQAAIGPVGVAEVASFDRAIGLPDLPVVRGAHEVTVLGVAALCAPLVLWNQTFLTSATAPIPHVVSEAQRNTHAEDGPAPPPPSAAPERSTTPVSQASIAGRVEVTTDTTLQAASVPTRVVTLRATNLRERPDASARVLRVLDPATCWTAFDRQGAWVQVGESSRAGWVHSTLLRSAP